MPFKKIGALWKHENGDRTFCTGHIELGPLFPDLDIVVFENKKKAKDNQPDFIICKRNGFKYAGPEKSDK